MNVCERYRIPHSHFLGGALVWTQQDRDKAIWHQIRNAQTCSSCGTHPEEWDPAQGGDRHAYVAELSRCPGCAAVEQQQEAVETAKKDEKTRGQRVVLKRREDPGAGNQGAGGEPGGAGASGAPVAVGG